MAASSINLAAFLPPARQSRKPGFRPRKTLIFAKFRWNWTRFCGYEESLRTVKPRALAGFFARAIAENGVLAAHVGDHEIAFDQF
jgi:hypothetical protein